MKILLSAFNCNPKKGSEYGRGWAWVLGLTAIGHEVWVITEADNQSSIEQFLVAHPLPNCQFFFCPLAPSADTWWKFKGRQIGLLTQRFELEWRLLMWQWQAYQTAKELAAQIKFDYVHHVTNTCIRRPSFMGLLEVPFIVGPISGGVKAPWSLRKSYSSINWLVELGRDISNEFVRFNPLTRLMFAKAAKIYCDSSQTQALLGSERFKSQVLFSMPSCRMLPDPQTMELQRAQKDHKTFRVLYAGRFMCWKGLHLGLQAFAQLHQQVPNSRFTLIGEGPEAKRLRQLAEQLQIQECLDWIPWVDQAELSRAYLQHDVLLFPSLHEMGGNVILEALSHGLPTVCLNLGGPGVMVNETCGRVINTDRATEAEVIERLSHALLELAHNPEVRQRLSQGALTRKDQFSWSHVVDKVYSPLAVEKDLSPLA